MTRIDEKPGKANAASNLASVNAYLLPPDIMPYIEACVAEHDGQGEIKLQTAIQKMISDGHAFYAFEVQNAHYHDAGNKLEYVKTVIDFALRREDIGKEIEAYLREIVANLDK
jgi:UTP--glucose-1-phosphate uridylyltransferase